MSLLLDALKKAAEEKEKKDSDKQDNASTEQKEEVYTHEVDEGFLLDERVSAAGDNKTVAIEEPAEEVFDLELPEDVPITDDYPVTEDSPATEDYSVTEHSLADDSSVTKDLAETETVVDKSTEKEAAKHEEMPKTALTDAVVRKTEKKESSQVQAEHDLTSYDHKDARKILEVTQKRYRNNQRIAYYGMYVFATILFFTGSYLYYTAEVLDNSDKPVFKTKNKIASQPKTEIEKKIEEQVLIAKAKLAVVDDSEEKNVTMAVVPKAKKLIKPVKIEQPITITSQKREDPLSLILQRAYKHYQAAEYKQAEQLYQSVLQRDGRQKDALLGRAAIAVVNKDYALARRFYQQLLHYFPRDSIASSALVDLNRQEVTSANESQLNILLEDNPKAAHVYFSLGLLYAKQQRVKESQQAFFEAYALDKKADYAYNLAVMLDKLGQTKAALSYYRLASTLSDKHASNFNEKFALERIAQLETGNE